MSAGDQGDHRAANHVMLPDQHATDFSFEFSDIFKNPLKPVTQFVFVGHGKVSELLGMRGYNQGRLILPERGKKTSGAEKLYWFFALFGI